MSPKSIYFLRHGAADRDQWDGADFERPLTARGAQRTECVVRSLARAGAAPGLFVLTSPLVRALQSARIASELLDAPLAVDDLLGPGFSAEDLATILLRSEGIESLMLVGHEPSFSEVIAEVIGGGGVVMKKSACARIDLGQGTALRGELVWLLTPGSLGC